jgi:ribosome biogenesis SPOUT family RNA methylase Rps3
MDKPIFIIEHLEEELYEWCKIEYESISKIVGKESLYFTNIKEKDINYLQKLGKVFKESVKKLKFENACILDPEAKETLTPNNSKKLSFFIFGGILGDNPPRKRTEEELTPFLKDIKAFNIGKEQFSTDNAVFVTHEIINGTPMNQMQFQDELEIKIDQIMSTILPYRYPIVNGKPRISQKLVDFIIKRDQIR